MIRIPPNIFSATAPSLTWTRAWEHTSLRAPPSGQVTWGRGGGPENLAQLQWPLPTRRNSPPVGRAEETPAGRPTPGPASGSSPPQNGPFGAALQARGWERGIPWASTHTGCSEIPQDSEFPQTSRRSPTHPLCGCPWGPADRAP